MITDPVCGMEMRVAETKASLIYEGGYYCFCSVGCMAEFQRHPEEYAGQAVTGGEEARESV